MPGWLKKIFGATPNTSVATAASLGGADKRLTQSFAPADTSQDLLRSTLGDLLRKVASEVPDRIALVEGVADPAKRRRWTYKQLVDQSEQLARGLLYRFKPGERVGLIAADTPEWVIV